MNNPSIQMLNARLALGHGASLIEEYHFLRKQGWHTHWNPDACVQRAEGHARKLIWC